MGGDKRSFMITKSIRGEKAGDGAKHASPSAFCFAALAAIPPRPAGWQDVHFLPAFHTEKITFREGARSALRKGYIIRLR